MSAAAHVGNERRGALRRWAMRRTAAMRDVAVMTGPATTSGGVRCGDERRGVRRQCKARRRPRFQSSGSKILIPTAACHPFRRRTSRLAPRAPYGAECSGVRLLGSELARRAPLPRARFRPDAHATHGPCCNRFLSAAARRACAAPSATVSAPAPHEPTTGKFATAPPWLAARVSPQGPVASFLEFTTALLTSVKKSCRC
ncbi:hypothetical protein FGB62_255g010 [Gracilaria domingensis]|nr:hypothetical protein FGB62_255g010 [Gracilaria domingensis]